MLRALELARLGQASTAPNPCVGAVVVAGDQCVGEGWHRAAGEPHAEALALNEAGERAQGATLYVTLEPCCHTGRTGPCTERVLAAGISRVVVGLVDPDPRVCGRGMAQLVSAGVLVDLAPPEMRRLCAFANLFFLKAVKTGRPFLTMKYAATLDGKIATRTGHSQWITGPQARSWVHEQRALHQAVLVGVGTVLADDPQLDARVPRAVRQPWRVVADSHARTPPQGRLLTTAAGPVLIAVTAQAPASRVEALRSAGARVEVVESRSDRVDLGALTELLASLSVQSVLLEGGAQMNAAALEQGLVSRLAAFIAPRLIGGTGAPGPIGGLGAERLELGWELEQVECHQVGKDLLIEGLLSCPWLTY